MNEFAKELPPLVLGTELNNQLRILPEYDSNIRKASSPQRLIALRNIRQVFIPNKMSREIYCKLYLSLLHSLEKKTSIQAARQYNENKKMIRQQYYESILGGSDSFTILGESGIGKTSSINRAIGILSPTPVMKTSDTSIISFLQIQAPSDGSAKGLLLETLRRADEMLGSNYFEKALKSRFTTDVLVGIVSTLALTHVGILVVDEIQNLVNSKNGRVVVGMLMQLINNSGTGICMIGGPETKIFFTQSMMMARRTLGLNYNTMEYDDDFREFCKTLLRYIYVKNTPVINEELLMWLYQHSSGNASVVVGLIHDAQETAILEETEKLDLASLTSAFRKKMNMLQEFILTEPIKAPVVKNPAPNIPETIIRAPEIVVNSMGQTSEKAKKKQEDVVFALEKSGIPILRVKL